MKKRRFLLAFTALCFLSLAQAQQMIPKKAYWYLTGTVSKNISIVVNLVKAGDSLYADCIFSGIDKRSLSSFENGKPVTFCGRMDAKGVFQMKPFGSQFPVFRGQLSGSGSFRGDYLENADAKPLKFDLNEVYQAGSVQFRVYTSMVTVKLAKGQKSPSGNLRMALLSPMESGNPKVSDSLRTIMLRAFGRTDYAGNNPDSVLARSSRVFKQEYISGNEDLYKQMPDAPSLNWELLRFSHIVCNQDYTLSFYILNYAFTGGAHGMETIDFTNVDLKSGSLLTLDKIIAEGKMQELNKLLTRKLKQMNMLSESQKLTDKGYFVDEIKPVSNFYLTPSGIGFVYNHYDIAPYSFGATDIFLTADEVRNLLLPDVSVF